MGFFSLRIIFAIDRNGEKEYVWNILDKQPKRSGIGITIFAYEIVWNRMVSDYG